MKSRVGSELARLIPDGRFEVSVDATSNYSFLESARLIKEILVDAYDDRKIDLKEYEFNKIENRVDIVVGKFDEKIDYKMIDQQLENTLKSNFEINVIEDNRISPLSSIKAKNGNFFNLSFKLFTIFLTIFNSVFTYSLMRKRIKKESLISNIEDTSSNEVDLLFFIISHMIEKIKIFGSNPYFKKSMKSMMKKNPSLLINICSYLDENTLQYLTDLVSYSLSRKLKIIVQSFLILWN